MRRNRNRGAAEKVKQGQNEVVPTARVASVNDLPQGEGGIKQIRRKLGLHKELGVLTFKLSATPLIHGYFPSQLI